MRGGRGRPLAPGRASPIEDKRTGREERDGLSTRPHARPEAELTALASRDRPRQGAGWQHDGGWAPPSPSSLTRDVVPWKRADRKSVV